jgi:uroporphyrin-3 C-methyltransferase
MSDASAPIELAPDPAAHSVAPTVAAAALLSRFLVGVLAAAAIVALVIAIALWQKLSGIQEQLARQSTDSLAQSLEARTLARQANEVVRDTAARLALAETRVSEMALQRSQLEDLIQTLSRSRDENLVSDIEAAVRLALQQAQVTGNVQPLLTALKSAEQRVERASQPRLAPLQRALQRDADRLRAIAGADMGEALQRIDELIRGVDNLPTISMAGMRSSGNVLQTEPLPSDAPWWQAALLQVWAEARSLLRVSRIEQPEAVLVSPEQAFFLHENLKLKLLNARLSILSRQAENARSELASVSASINRYFEPSSRRVQAAATLLQQVQAQVKTAESPRVDETLAALTTAAAGR